ncbi:hypothetical protein GF362_07315 [Candidatus Dojkabacteria bacterium]|nr:hypothetical protein [Candidatus Dojkabacteria bacterium]
MDLRYHLVNIWNLLMKKTKKLENIGVKQDSRVLGIFPHPDDETVFSGGFLNKAVEIGASVGIASITKGERGNKNLKNVPPEKLGKIRVEELGNALEYLGINEYILGNFPDGEVQENIEKIKSFIGNLLQNIKPDFVLTLEPDGIYGHPDHIGVSRVVTDIHKEQKKFQLIYSTVSDQFKVSEGALRMADNPEQISPIKPNIMLKLSISNIIKKLKALKAHNSQFQGESNVWEKLRAWDFFRYEYFHIKK